MATLNRSNTANRLKGNLDAIKARTANAKKGRRIRQDESFLRQKATKDALKSALELFPSIREGRNDPNILGATISEILEDVLQEREEEEEEGKKMKPPSPLPRATSPSKKKHHNPITALHKFFRPEKDGAGQENQMKNSEGDIACEDKGKFLTKKNLCNSDPCLNPSALVKTVSRTKSAKRLEQKEKERREKKERRAKRRERARVKGRAELSGFFITAATHLREEKRSRVPVPDPNALRASNVTSTIVDDDARRRILLQRVPGRRTRSFKKREHYEKKLMSKIKNLSKDCADQTLEASWEAKLRSDMGTIEGKKWGIFKYQP